MDGLMLRAVDDGPAVVACSTCGKGDGVALIAQLRAVQETDAACSGVAVQAMPCLFACSTPCAVHLRAPGRMGYVLGGFAPTREAARAILDFARHHATSAEGEVAWPLWPEGVKGHFLVRVPPPGFVAE